MRAKLTEASLLAVIVSEIGGLFLMANCLPATEGSPGRRVNGRQFISTLHRPAFEVEHQQLYDPRKQAWGISPEARMTSVGNCHT